MSAHINLDIARSAEMHVSDPIPACMDFYVMRVKTFQIIPMTKYYYNIHVHATSVFTYNKKMVYSQQCRPAESPDCNPIEKSWHELKEMG